MLGRVSCIPPAIRNQGCVIKSTFNAVRLMSSEANVEFEHYRGQWKTYGDIEKYEPGRFQIQTFNKISPVGLKRFEEEKYDVRTDGTDAPNAHAILLRSHKLKEDEVPLTVRAIARYV